jgi:hypothetical protein
MKRALIAAALVAGLVFTTINAATDLGPDAKVVASEVAHSVIIGIILGSGVEPYQSKLVPDLIESRVMASGYVPAPTVDPYPVADE